MSKNIHLTFHEELFERFSGIVQRYRLKNVQEAIGGLVSMFCQRVEVNEKLREERRIAAPVQIEDEIADLFNELDSIHIKPEDTAPLKVHKPRRKNAERRYNNKDGEV
jgi:hypothetical protein